MTDQPIAFGDKVRVRDSVVTRAAGVAGLTGSVFGETIPSVSGVDTIGAVTGDYAINVYFHERGESSWFAPEMLEFVDHDAGTVVTIGGDPRKWTRTESGEWEELPGGEKIKSFWERICGELFRNK